jgi:hypothetical protein
VSLTLELQLERDSFGPGEPVTGAVLVVEGGGSRALEAALGLHEKSPDYEEVPVTITQTLHTGDLEAGQSFDISLQLPDAALPGYRSEHGELYWALDVKSDEAGFDTHVRKRIEVLPPPRTEEPDLFGADFADPS